MGKGAAWRTSENCWGQPRGSAGTRACLPTRNALCISNVCSTYRASGVESPGGHETLQRFLEEPFHQKVCGGAQREKGEERCVECLHMLMGRDELRWPSYTRHTQNCKLCIPTSKDKFPHPPFNTTRHINVSISEQRSRWNMAWCSVDTLAITSLCLSSSVLRSRPEHGRGWTRILESYQTEDS